VANFIKQIKNDNYKGREQEFSSNCASPLFDTNQISQPIGNTEASLKANKKESQIQFSMPEFFKVDEEEDGDGERVGISGAIERNDTG